MDFGFRNSEFGFKFAFRNSRRDANMLFAMLITCESLLFLMRRMGGCDEGRGVEGFERCCGEWSVTSQEGGLVV